jgi:hypothetical protein
MVRERGTEHLLWEHEALHSNSSPTKKQNIIKNKLTHTCNSSYSGGRDQEDRVRSQTRQILHETLSQKKKKKSQKGLMQWLKVKA